MKQKFLWYFIIFSIGGVVTISQAANTFFELIAFLLIGIGLLNLANYRVYQRTKKLLAESEAKIYPERAKNLYSKQEWPDWSDKIWKQFEENMNEKYASYMKEREKLLFELEAIEEAEKDINPMMSLLLLPTRKFKRTVFDYEDSLSEQYNCAKSYIAILSNLLSRIHIHLDTLYLFKRMNITELYKQKEKLEAVNEQIDFHKRIKKQVKDFQERVDIFTIDDLERVSKEISDTMERITEKA